MEATFNGTSAQLSVQLLAEDDSDVLPTSVESQVVNADVTLQSLSLMSLGGISSSLTHL